MKNLKGKVSVVTGAGSGIGRATALCLTARGSVVAVCDLDEGRAKATADAIVALGGRASVHQVDVASEAAMRALVDDVITEHGLVDIVVNNAGIAPPVREAVDIDLAQFRKVMDVNLWGVVHGSLCFLPTLLRRPEANLVNVASNAALTGYSRMAQYATSKFAVRGFTESLQMELRSSPVTVTLVCPGLTHTSLMANSPVLGASERQSMQAAIDKGWARSAESVGEAILRSIQKDQPRCLVGPDTKILDKLARLTPQRYAKLLGPAVDMGIKKTMNR